MKALFVFDTVLLKEKNNYYGMTLTYDFFKNRYLKIYDDMFVATKVKDKVEGNVLGYKKTNGDNVIITPIKNYKEIPDSIIKRKKIKQELETIIEKVDIVIVRMPSVLGIITCEICRKNNKKYLIEMVACAWDGYMNHTNSIGKIIAPIMYLKTRSCIKKAEKVLYVTNEFLQKRYPTNAEQIACSDVILEEIKQEILEKRIKKIKNIERNNEIKLCTVANVGMKYKGQEYVIKAVSLLNSKEHKYKYYLVGNGSQERLKNIARKYNVENDIIFLGSLSHKDVFQVLDNIDIYIQPSLQEGLPRALLEAMSRACPCIGAITGGIPELLEKEYIFSKKNFIEIKNILDNLQKEKLIESSIKCFEKVKEFESEKLDKKRATFYK